MEKKITEDKNYDIENYKKISLILDNFESSPLQNASNLIIIFNDLQFNDLLKFNENNFNDYVSSFILSLLICEKTQEAKINLGAIKANLDPIIYTPINNIIKDLSKKSNAPIYQDLITISNKLQRDSKNRKLSNLNKVALSYIDIHEKRVLEFLKTCYSNIRLDLYTQYFKGIINNEKDLLENIQKNNLKVVNNKSGLTFIVFKDNSIKEVDFNIRNEGINFVNNCTVLLENIAKANPSTLFIADKENI